MNVAILGASKNTDRYSYLAFQMLKEYGHIPFPVSPKFAELDGVKTYSTLKDIHETIDTLTMYVGAEISTKLKSDILALKPRRVIFNPGSENSILQDELKESGIEVEEACTLVLLRTNQF
jgi:uncharacterized protein